MIGILSAVDNLKIMPPKIGLNRNIERQGVNAIQEFFERNNSIFQEIAQQNDYGKDAYIDLTQGDYVSPLCIAVQIKSGNSYRTPKGDYFIPVNHHAITWRNSTVPVFGIVYDPDDLQLRWIDITAYLRKHSMQDGGNIPVSKNSLLNEHSLAKEFKQAASSYAAAMGQAIVMKLLSENTEFQSEAVLDAWGLGRSDARFLIILRRLILHLDTEATRRAIWALSHATNHPDIFWGANNWIPESVRWKIQSSFQWSTQEITHLFCAVDPDEWGRGTMGQSLHMLLAQDFRFGTNFHVIIQELLDISDMEHAISAILLYLSLTEDPQGTLLKMFEVHPALLESERLKELYGVLIEYNEFSIY